MNKLFAIAMTSILLTAGCGGAENGKASNTTSEGKTSATTSQSKTSGSTYDVEFQEGNVIIHCSASSKGGHVSEAVFNAALPEWIPNLQKHANDGRVVRAHFLNELMEGILIVVTGKNREEAMSNALMINAENKAIMKMALEKAGVDKSSAVSEEPCTFLEFGPVAVLPR